MGQRGRPKSSEPRWFEFVDQQKIIDLYITGSSCSSIVVEMNLGVDSKSVLRFLRLNGIPIRGRYERLLPVLCPGCNENFEIKDAGWNRKLCLTCSPSQVWYQRWVKYQITKPQFDEMWENQGGLCGLCEEDMDYEEKVVIDHCHKQGHIRAILHNRCNIGLHYIENDKFFASAIRYIERHKR